MPAFNPADYDTVHSRLQKFWADHPGGAVITEVAGVTPDHKSIIIRAEVWFSQANARPTGVGIAQEHQSGSGPNSTSWAENCDTSAVGRALANCGYSGDRRPSREEMQKTERPAYQTRASSTPARPAASRPVAGEIKAAGEIKPCAKCGLPVRMAFEDGKTERYNADGSLHFRRCGTGPTGYGDEPGMEQDLYPDD